MAEQPFAEVIGDPIAHSKSPLIHRFWLAAAGLEGDYRKVHVTAEGLADYFAQRRGDPAWRGCNVTVPHKRAVIDHVDDPGQVLDSIGAMNTIVRAQDASVFGTNTDAAGFYAPIAELDLAGQPVTVVGAGGAACAVLFALKQIGVGQVTVLNRSPLKGVAMLHRFGLKGKALPIDSGIGVPRLLVNASTMGMKGQPPFDPDLSGVPDDTWVYDLVYAPLETPLLAAAHARGLQTVDGLEMLVGQAALAFELFFGVAPRRDRDEELRALLTA